MVFVKNKVFLLLLVGFIFCGDWVLNYKGFVFNEDNFYDFFPEKEWSTIKDKERKQELFFDYIKRSASVYEAKNLGLHLRFDVEKKLSSRFERLLVNEYYMRDFLFSVTPKAGLAFCKKNTKKGIVCKSYCGGKQFFGG